MASIWETIRSGESHVEWLERLRVTGDRRNLLLASSALLARAWVNAWPTISASTSQQTRYIAMRLDGVSHSLAEMLALGQPPMANSDREFLEGHCNGSQFEKTPGLGDYYAKVARRHGQDTTGKVYLSGLAAFPGDPRAWVSDRHEVQKVLAERGWGAEGSVNCPVSKVAPSLGKALADDIVEDAVDDFLGANPEAALERREDIAESVSDKLKPHWAD